MIPGEVVVDNSADAIEANVGRETVTLLVKHTGDRPIQVGSHVHFFEFNAGLDFDRASAYGMRLNVPAGTAVRFEPGDAKEVTLVALAGKRIALGHRGVTQGPLDDKATKEQTLEASA